MEIETKDVITLTNGEEYVVCSKIDFNENKYLYLINPINQQDIKFVMETARDNKIFVSEIENENLIRQLLPLFYEKSKDIITEIDS